MLLARLIYSRLNQVIKCKSFPLWLNNTGLYCFSSTSFNQCTPLIYCKGLQLLYARVMPSWERGYPRAPTVCVHVQVPALRLGTKRVVPPRGAGAVGHCPSGHSGQDRCYLSAVSEKDTGTQNSYCSELEFSNVMHIIEREESA